MSEKVGDSPLLEGLIKGLRPPDRVGVLDWLEHHARFPHSDRNKRFDRTTAPWLNPVIESFVDIDTKLIICRGPVGSSKTTLFEALHQYIPSQDPGPMMTVTQSDEDTTDWVETRLIRCLEACEPLRHLWPRERVKEKIKKDKHLWPHMFSLFGGANLNTLQSKSIRWGLGDEPWLWKKGMIREFEGRFHDRENRCFLLVSQGGVAGSEYSQKYDQTDRSVRSFECPQCSKVQPYEWSSIKWDTHHVGDDPFQPYDWKRIQHSVRYECTGCGHTWRDAPVDRRSLSNIGFYVPSNNDSLEGCKGFHWNALSVYWISWFTLVYEWLNAIDAKKRGNAELFWQFMQKRMAEDEVLTEAPEYGDLMLSDYELPVENCADKINNEVHRFLTVDKQIDHYWSVIRAWRADGSSRLLYAGRTLTEGDIEGLQHRFGISKKKVTIDAQYDTPNVYKMCARHGWTALHGSREAGFTHFKGRGKHRDRELRFVSKVETANLGGGNVCLYMFFAASRIKDILVNLRSGRGASWELPCRVPKDYVDQIDSEVKRKFIDRKTKQEVYDYVKIKDANHLWDCEVHQTTMAYAVGLLGGDPEADYDDEKTGG
jgi:hypothetical protein